MLKAINFMACQKINKKTPLIVSVSGGVDSISLLHLLKQYNFHVIVVHFNHHQRKANDDEAKLVEQYAKNYQLPFYLFDINVLSGNFQSEARKQRHEYLRDVANKYQTKYILTAHHLDDLAETILMKITRGSNLYGYAGIHHTTIIDDFIFLKPLLEYSKQDIIKYARQYQLDYLEDESNYLTHYTRNRIRLNVMPILKQENHQVLNKMYDYHVQLKESFNFIRKYSSKLIVDNQVNIKKYLKEDSIIQDEILAILLDNYQITSSLNLINDLKNVIKSPRPNLTYTLNSDYIFIKSYDDFYIAKDIVIKPFEVNLVNGRNMLPNMKNITLLLDNKSSNKKYVKICYNKIQLPLVARTRKDGDLLQFPFGSKKLKDYLIDKKINRNLRDELIVITDSNNIILYVEDIYNNQTIGNNNELLLYIENAKEKKI